MAIPMMKVAAAGTRTRTISDNIRTLYLAREGSACPLTGGSGRGRDSFACGRDQFLHVLEPPFIGRAEDHGHDRLAKTDIKNHREIAARKVSEAGLAQYEPGYCALRLVGVESRCVVPPVRRCEYHAVPRGPCEERRLRGSGVREEVRNITRRAVRARLGGADIESARIEKIGAGETEGPGELVHAPKRRILLRRIGVQLMEATVGGPREYLRAAIGGCHQREVDDISDFPFLALCKSLRASRGRGVIGNRDDVVVPQYFGNGKGQRHFRQGRERELDIGIQFEQCLPRFDVYNDGRFREKREAGERVESTGYGGGLHFGRS